MPGYRTCCISYEPVHPDRLLVVRTGETSYFFDVQSLYRSYTFGAHHVPTNPFTNLPLNPRDAKRVIDYGKSLGLLVTVNGTIHRIHDYDTVGSVLCKILSKEEDIYMDVVSDGASLYAGDLELDHIGHSECIVFRRFATSSEMVEAMAKLRDYTVSRLWENNGANAVLHYMALECPREDEERQSTSPYSCGNFIVLGNLFVPSWQ